MRIILLSIISDFCLLNLNSNLNIAMKVIGVDDCITKVKFQGDMKYYRDDNVFIIVLIIIICITFIIACLTSFPILFLSLRLNFINSIITCMKSCGQGKHHSQEVQISQSNNHKKKIILMKRFLFL